MPEDCKTCDNLSGRNRLSSVESIYTGKYWVVEHAYPTTIKGWLVLVLKRHVEALHQLTEAEWIELARLHYYLTKRLWHMLGREKEYSMCFAEGVGFAHIHFHLVAKPDQLPAELKAGKIFACLHPEPGKGLDIETINSFVEAFKYYLNNISLLDIGVDQLDIKTKSRVFLEDCGINSIGVLSLHSKDDLLYMSSEAKEIVEDIESALLKKFKIRLGE